MSKLTVGKIMRMLIWAHIEREMKLAPLRFHRQDRREKQRRLQLIERLGYELHLAKEKSGFCTAYADDIIGEVFDGNWDEVRNLVAMLDEEQEESRLFGGPGSLTHLQEFVAVAKAALTEVEA
jgi:hypothetical protein